MSYNYRVYVKVAEQSPWIDTGIIERDKRIAEKAWYEHIKRLGYYGYYLEPITYGIPLHKDLQAGQQHASP